MRSNESTISSPTAQLRLIAYIAISMLAFAANSIFCRVALMQDKIDPESFTVVRLLSGGLFLWCLLKLGSPSRPLRGSWSGGLCLFLYAYAFSIAYVSLGAGIGALILFGAVQVTMFAYGWIRGERVDSRGVFGMLIAFIGLVALLLPGANSPQLGSALVMIASGVAWGVYSLLGRGAADPLAATTGNFVRALPGAALLAAYTIWRDEAFITGTGLTYALASGALASGLGYAIWYQVVKCLAAYQAATLQLTVPIMASIGGVMLLGENLTTRLVVISLVVLGGVAIAILPSGKAE